MDIKDKEGKIITDEKKILNKFEKYFKESTDVVLNVII